MSYSYYLVFALPVAALVVRDPDGPAGCGIFDQLVAVGDRRRAVGICVSLAAALSIARVALPGPPTMILIGSQPGVLGLNGTTPVFPTTELLAPLLWLAACTAIIVSYARRPALGGRVDAPTTSSSDEPALTALSQEDSQ